MVSNKGRNTKLEFEVRKAVHRAGMKGYRVNYRIGRTRVDIAFPSKKLAILVHGCFWHRCAKCNLPLPKTHRAFWAKKFQLNKARDKRVRTSLRNEGWDVLELWEHQIKQSVAECVRRIRAALE
jgi:DNA mismatch endonuclease (patch repair protein)